MLTLGSWTQELAGVGVSAPCSAVPRQSARGMWRARAGMGLSVAADSYLCPCCRAKFWERADCSFLEKASEIVMGNVAPPSNSSACAYPTASWLGTWRNGCSSC